MSSSAMTPRDSFISAGEPAPDFTLKDHNRNDFTLSQAVNQGDVVLCFFPLAFTGVCGTEMDCITKDLAKWSAKGVQVVGISCDSFATLKAWADSAGYKQTFLADMHRQVCKAYGIYWPDLNVSGRGTVIITKGASGPIVKWSQKREIKNAMNFDEVIAAMS